MLRRFTPFLALTVALTLFAGCDTTDPEPPSNPEEVVGTYEFVEFRFDPQGQGITDADVLGRLVAEATSLELVNTQRGGQFQLRYRFEEDAFGDLVNGTYTVTDATVTLSLEAGDAGSLSDLLLGDRIVLQRSVAEPDVLSLNETRTVDLEAYDPEQYGDSGLNNVSGTLEVEIRRLGR